MTESSKVKGRHKQQLINLLDSGHLLRLTFKETTDNNC